MKLHQIARPELPQLRLMVEEYWQELMPKADVLTVERDRNAYFRDRFSSPPDTWSLFWAALPDGRKVGFVNVEIDKARKLAVVQDFYIVPQARRSGNGSAAVAALMDLLDACRVERIDLNVRRDNPVALAFWEAQGFRVALHRMRMYRDPDRRVAFVGALSSDF